MMSWFHLAPAGLFESGWPVDLKMAQEPNTRVAGIALAVAFMTLSGTLLWMAQRQVPIGKANAEWTGIGAAGTFVVGVLYFGDPASLMRLAGVALIVLGVVVLKLALPRDPAPNDKPDA